MKHALFIFLICLISACSKVKSDQALEKEIHPGLARLAQQNDITLSRDITGKTIVTMEFDNRVTRCHNPPCRDLNSIELDIYSQNILLDMEEDLKRYGVDELVLRVLNWRDSSVLQTQTFNISEKELE